MNVVFSCFPVTCKASAFISCQHYPYTQSYSKVFDVIKAIWPSFNHWENWVVPPLLPLLPCTCTKQTKSNQSYKRLLIDVILLEVRWWTGHDWLLLSATCLALSWRFMSTLIWCLIFFWSSHISPQRQVLTRRGWWPTTSKLVTFDHVHIFKITLTVLTRSLKEKCHCSRIISNHIACRNIHWFVIRTKLNHADQEIDDKTLHQV